MSIHIRHDRNRALAGLLSISIALIAYGIYWCLH